MLRLSSDFYWESDAAHRITELLHGPRWVSTQTPGSQIGKTRWEIPSTRPDAAGWAAHRATLEGHLPFQDFEFARIDRDGVEREFVISGEPVFDEEGRFLGYRGIGREVTALRAAEKALRESEERFRAVVDSANEGILVYDSELRITGANAAAEHILGVPRDQLIGKPGFTSLFPCIREDGSPLKPEDRPTRITLARGTAQTALVLGLQRPGGTLTWLSINTAFLRRAGEGAFSGIVSTIADITTERNAQAALRESEARFRSLTHLSSDWYWETDEDYRLIRIEGRQASNGSLRTPGLLGRHRWDTGLEVEGGWEAHRAVIAARQPFHDLVMWRILPGGQLRYISVSGEPVYDPHGRFTGYRGIGREISAQKRAEQLLKLEHQVARSLSEAADAASGVQGVIRAVCEAEGWVAGRYFSANAAGEMRCTVAWHVDDPQVARFVEGSRSLAFRAGEGLVGRVWQIREPLWSTDTINDPRVKAQSLHRDCGIRGVFLFPLPADGRIVGVLSFASRSVREPDERLQQAARVIGSQIGQFLQRKQAEEALRESEARFRSLTQLSSDFFWETDAGHRFTQIVHGPRYFPSQMTKSALGKAAWDLPSVKPDAAGWAAHRASFESHAPFRDFEFARRIGERVRHFAVSGEPRFADDGTFLGYRGVGRDITEIATARERIASLAFSDALTGLANRTSLAPALEQAVERARRHGHRLAALFMDLDGFKGVNDELGHDAGDRVLIEVARRLRASLRAIDLVARLGGDEFFVVLEDVPALGNVELVARKLLSEIERPYAVGPGMEARISVSIGLSLYPDDAQDAASLVKHADTAMYAAKQAGKNAYRLFAA
jgi:diguanylate cyclase (GGDEF)-like protein/PAS domain S-box-containing protein